MGWVAWPLVFPMSKNNFETHIFFKIEEMANIQDIEKEIIQLQEKIESALSELNKPRGIMAKYAKLAEFENGRIKTHKNFIIFPVLLNVFIHKYRDSWTKQRRDKH